MLIDDNKSVVLMSWLDSGVEMITLSRVLLRSTFHTTAMNDFITILK